MEDSVYYVGFGDSLTGGTGASIDSLSFCNKYFNAIKKSAYCRYINLGRSGLTSDELLQSMVEPAVKNHCVKATDITITIGGNDLIQFYLEHNDILNVYHSITSLKKNITQILSNIHHLNPNAQVLLMGFYNPGQPDHPLFAMANFIIKKINRLLQKLTVHDSHHFVDPFEAFLNQTHLLADEVHPNDLGYHILFDLFIKTRNQKLLVMS